MMNVPLLYRMPTLVVAGALALTVVLSLALAHALGSRVNRRGWNGELGALETMASGLLGLLLAFNFSFAQERYESRAKLLVDESNAIGTAYLRCSFLEDEDAAFCRDRLRHYVGLRIGAYAALGRSSDAPAMRTQLADAVRVQNELWERTARIARDRPTTSTALLMASLNEVIDLDADRRASVRLLVPQAITVAIMLACVAWALLLGYAAGAKGQRPARTFWLIEALLISLVFGVALDLDRPRSGVITTAAAERTMDELRDAVAAPPTDRR